MKAEKRETVEEYLRQFPQDQQNYMNQLRAWIKKALPECQEKLSWGAPTYYLKGRYCLQFAASQKHLGFYTSPATITKFQEELKFYSTNAKNTLRLRWDQPLPEDLLNKMIRFRAEEVFKEDPA